MRAIEHTLSIAGAILLVGSAAAADLTGAELKTLISGESVYLEIPRHRRPE
jgi:hypothetical protein